MIPIPGTSSKQRLEENVAAIDIEGAAAGKRYDPALLGLTNQ